MSAIAEDLFPRRSRNWDWLVPVVLGLIMAMGLFVSKTKVPDGGGEDDGLGNLWVDTNGGTCTRQSSAGAYVDAQACSSLNTAYAAAECSDVIRVKAGTYSSVTISETATGTGCGNNARMVMRPALGATTMTCGVSGRTLDVEVVNIPWIGLGPFGSTTSPDNLTLMGFNTRLGISAFGDTNNITIDCFDGGAFIIGASDSADDSTNVRITGSDWGPCGSRSIIGECSHSGDDSCNPVGGESALEFCSTGRTFIDDNFGHMTDGIYIEDNIIHDFLIEPEIPPQDPDHWECLFNGGANNLEVRRNWFYNCETNAIANPGGDETLGAWIFENNWFGNAESGNAALKWGELNAPVSGTVLVRFNSFAPNNGAGTETTFDMDTDGKFSFIGNIFGENYDGCMQEAIYQYNVYLVEAGCDATDETVSAPLPYVNTDGAGAADYHLSGASVADGLVPGAVANSGLLLDKDGVTRPVPRTAGSLER